MMKEENEGQSQGVSRRNFLRGSIVTVAAAVPALTLIDKAEAAKQNKPAPAAPPAKPAEAAPAKPAKSLLVFRKNCTGCHSCEYACSLYHEGVVHPAAARIHVRRVKGIVDIVSICWHCTDAPCVEACPITPKKAIYKDKESNTIKYLDEKLCLGAKCNKCVEVACGESQDHSEGAAEECKAADHYEEAENEACKRCGTALRSEFPGDDCTGERAEYQADDLRSDVLHDTGAADLFYSGGLEF